MSSVAEFKNKLRLFKSHFPTFLLLTHMRSWREHDGDRLTLKK